MEEILSPPELRSLARKGNNVLPVAIRLRQEDVSPFATFRDLLELKNEFKGSVFFEGVEPTGQRARYSWIGLHSLRTWTVDRGAINGVKTPNLMSALDRELSALKCPTLPDFPSFYAGVTGYLGYDCVRYLEPKLGARKHTHPIPHPEAFLQLHETWIVFDHAQNWVWIVSAIHLPLESFARGLARTRKANGRALELLNRPRKKTSTQAKRAGSGLRMLRSKRNFVESIRSLKRHIRAGDIFQCVLSNQFWLKTRKPAIELYRELRHRNPSPYMFYLELPNGAVLFGASPERLVKVNAGVAETHPIAGTRPRGKEAGEDERFERNLLDSAKEKAEHMMLVDLGRNDLGRVCVPGSVHVSRMMRVERFSHVMHIVSTVQGKIRAGISPLRVLYSCFPAGTLSGAPKFRAMELIESHEQASRGLYGGAVVQLGFNGYLDSCIAIRSALYHQGQVCIQAGAGIVFDSRAEMEFEETLHKSRVLREVCG